MIIIITINLLFAGFTKTYMSNVKVGYKDKKVFNDLNRLITDISNNKIKKEDAIKKLEKSISDLNQQRQEKSTVFWNKMIQVL